MTGSLPPDAAGTPGGAPPPAHQPPPGAHAMNVVRWVLFAGLLALAVASLASYVISKRPRATGAGASATRVVYQCPMHPNYTSDRPGECPICGMSLEKVETAGAHDPSQHPGDVPGLSTVQLSPERIQMIGVRTAVVKRRALGGTLDLVGFVTPDERRLKRIQLRVSGWVRRLEVNQTGERVVTGQPLLTLYSPELYQSEQEYLIEMAVHDTASVMAHDAGAAASGRQRLRLLGVPEEEIARLDREHVASTQLELRSPVTGTVLERGVSEGQFVGPDTPLFTVADLSRLWVLADLYEMDYSRLRVGDRVRFVPDALGDRVYEGRVDFLSPTVSVETRTLKARIELSNLDGLLRPGMYGRAEVAGRAGSSLFVPGEAVVSAGEHDYVFVAHEGGRFEPRLVRPGLRDGDDVQILHGVAAGDTVVSSASFLIDSESRLRTAIAGMGRQPAAGHAH